MNNLLLEGNPGAGKTTLLRNVAARLSDLHIGGFYTGEIRENGVRAGFAIDTFTGISGILAHVSYQAGPRVGKYTVDVGAFDEIGVLELRRALSESRVILIDEIGRMELFSAGFKETVVACLDSPRPVIATIMSHPDPFVRQLKSRADCHLLTVTVKNRDTMLEQVITRVRDATG